MVTRTPWGWPGHRRGPDGTRGRYGNNRNRTLRRWLRGLSARKRTVDDAAYRERVRAAFDSLVTGRSGAQRTAAEGRAAGRTVARARQ